MLMKSTQKVIKIGSSGGVTIPAKDMKRAGIRIGDELTLSYEKTETVSQHQTEIVALTQKLITRHKQALKNLSQR